MFIEGEADKKIFDLHYYQLRDCRIAPHEHNAPTHGRRPDNFVSFADGRPDAFSEIYVR